MLGGVRVHLLTVRELALLQIEASMPRGARGSFVVGEIDREQLGLVGLALVVRRERETHAMRRIPDSEAPGPSTDRMRRRASARRNLAR